MGGLWGRLVRAGCLLSTGANAPASGSFFPWELAVGQGGWKWMLQGCSKSPRPAVYHSPIIPSSRRCCRAAIFSHLHIKHNTLHTLAALCCAPVHFPLPPSRSRSIIPHPQGPSQAGVRADRGLAVGKSTILKERERSVKV